MKYNNLRRIAKEKKITLKQLAIDADLTEVGFHQAIKNDTLAVHTLEKIADILDVPIIDLLDQQSTKKQLPIKTNEDYLQQIRNSLEDITQALGYPNQSRLTEALNRIADALEKKE